MHVPRVCLQRLPHRGHVLHHNVVHTSRHSPYNVHVLKLLQTTLSSKLKNWHPVVRSRKDIQIHKRLLVQLIVHSCGAASLGGVEPHRLETLRAKLP